MRNKRRKGKCDENNMMREHIPSRHSRMNKMPFINILAKESSLEKKQIQYITEDTIEMIRTTSKRTN